TADASASSGPEGYVYLGSAEGRRFYARRESMFSDFMLATLPLPAPSPPRYPSKQATPAGPPKTTTGVAPRTETPHVRPKLIPPTTPTPQQIPGSSEPVAPLFR